MEEEDSEHSAQWAREFYRKMKEAGLSDEQIKAAVDGLGEKKRKAYIAPDIFLRALCAREKQDVVDLLKRDDVELVSDLFALYEAIACIRPEDDFDRAALIAIFKKVKFTANEELRPLYVPLKVERMNSLRLAAGMEVRKHGKKNN